MIKYFALLGVLLVLMVACGESEEEVKLRDSEKANLQKYLKEKFAPYDSVKTASGAYLYYKHNKEGNALKIEKGDTVNFFYSAFAAEYAADRKVDEGTLNYVYGSNQLIEGVEAGLGILNNKSESTVVFSSDLGYGGGVVGAIDRFSSLKFIIKVLDVRNKSINAERIALKEKATADGFVYNPTYGYYKKAIETTSNALVKESQNVSYVFNAELLNGKTLYPLKTDVLSITNKLVLYGLRKSISEMHVGDSAQFWFPSELAYGRTKITPTGASTEVPEYSSVLFRIRVVSAK